MAYYLIYFIQILLVIHVLKTGRARYWVWLLLFIPLVGGIAYLVIEVLPGFTGSITGQRTLRGVRKAMNPGGDLRTHESAWRQSPNADNARRYARALLADGKPGEASAILERVLSGFFGTEPNLMLLKAEAEFMQHRAAGAVRILEELWDANPEFKSAEGHLLYAQALEAAGDLEKSLQEYRSVASYYPGAEARFRLGLALRNAGQDDDAIAEFEQMINDARLAPKHFQKSEKHWISSARRQLKEVTGDR